MNQQSNDVLFVQKLDLLEDKIGKAITKIEVLKNENLRLSQALVQAESQIDQLKNDLNSANALAAEAQEWKSQAQELTRIKSQIASKIENLLEQIETISTENP